ncbi:MAG: TonB-dependent receptor [Woeseiaceae bacterium]|nr:TonB-dependent receptor [Woeseiaceae bacterium]NIP22018.1 TonB-dependent receptor [Woeseiaceae bacterium]NIS91142.1 TonB-dependent receptor [Woeseiaceae bacterium]
MSKQIQATLRLGALLPVAAAGLAFSSTVYAQDEDMAIFEEIVVTVQRREQSIMDVPVAVSAISGTEIQAAGIKDMFDLQQNVVGLIVSQSQTSTTMNFSIRGVGSTSNNFGVESSVGLFVDGVYRSRQSSLVNDLADIETVEVARGPQGTLFGKNTASGAIIVRTVRPSQERDAYIDVTAGDLGLVKLSAASNISLGDNVAMRGTVFMSERDGYVDDNVLGSDYYNDRDRWGARLQLAVNEPGDDFNMRIIADYAEIDEVCCVAISRVDSIVSQSSLTSPTGLVFGSDAAIVGFGGNVFTDFPYPPGIFPPNVITGVGFDDYLVEYDSPPRSQNEDTGLSVEFNKDLGDNATLTSLTAWRTFDTYDEIDADFSPIALISRTNLAEVESISQELRISGEFGEGSNYVVGAYYFGQEIYNETFTGDASGIGTLRDYAVFTRPEITSAITLVNTVNALTGGPASPYPVAGDPFPPGVYGLDFVNQDQDGWAVFGQVDWSITDSFTLTLGARYTDETKKISSVFEQTLDSSATPPDIAALGLIACQLDQPPGCFATLPPPLQVPPDFTDPNTLAIFLPYGFEGWGSWEFGSLTPRGDINDQLSDDQMTGTVKLSFFPTDNSLIYGSVTTGFKSGGTNTERLPLGFDPIFDAETSTSFELGAKTQWGPMQLKAALYRMVFDDFQAQSFTGAGFNLQNAGELSTQGIELEMVWRPTDSTEIQANYAYNEGEYDDFEGGTCWDAYTFHTGIDDPGRTDPTSQQCSRTGDPLSANPENRAFLALIQSVDIGTNTQMVFRGEYSYASSFWTDGDLDPFTKQGSTELVNLRIGFLFDRINSELTLWGRNITDERWWYASFDQPLGFDRMNSYPAEPATYGLTWRTLFD